MLNNVYENKVLITLTNASWVSSSRICAISISSYELVDSETLSPKGL